MLINDLSCRIRVLAWQLVFVSRVGVSKIKNLSDSFAVTADRPCFPAVLAEMVAVLIRLGAAYVILHLAESAMGALDIPVARTRRRI